MLQIQHCELDAFCCKMPPEEIATKMPTSSAGFSFIEQYCNLSKQVLDEGENESSIVCTEILDMDQEVPQMRSTLEGGSDYANVNIKTEHTDMPTPDVFMEHMLINGTTSSNSVVPESRIPTVASLASSTESHQNASTMSSRQRDPKFNPFFSQNSTSPLQTVQVSAISSSQLSSSSSSSSPSSLSLSTSSTLSSSLSASSSPMMSSTTLAPIQSSFFNLKTSTPSFSNIPSTIPSTTTISNSSSNVGVKTTSYVTELGGSGCTVMDPQQYNLGDFLSGENYSLPNFLMADDNQSSPFLAMEESLDYLDLDQQQIPFSDDVIVKEEPSSQSRLVEAALLMRDVIHHDCDQLKVPYDPTMWTAEHVRTWVSWVCQKNKQPDISQVAIQLDGKSLCALTAGDFQMHYGNTGTKIRTELDLWKAANSTFPENEFTTTATIQQQQQQQQFSHLLPTTMFPLANETSPSPVPYTVVNRLQHTNNTPCVSPAPSSGSDSGLGGSSGVLTSDSDDEFGEGHVQQGAAKVGRGHKQTIYLWQFLRELLLSKENHTDCIRWLDRKAGIFKIEDSKKVAYLWGVRKNRPAMNYDKLSRSMRQYYKKKIIKKTEQSKRLVYQFCPGHF